MSKGIKQIIKLASCLSIFAPFVLLSSCTTGIMDNHNKKANEGESFIKIDGTLTPSNGVATTYHASLFNNEDAQFNWTVSDEDAAEIQAIEGNACTILPKKLGTTFITASLKDNPDIASTIQINVIKPSPSSITIIGKTEVYAGEDEKYEVTYEPEQCIEGVKWSLSSGQEKASISTKGVLTPNAEGDITIVATSKADESVSASLQVKILQARPKSIKINGPDLISMGGTATYSCQVYPEKSTSGVTWSFDTSSEYTGEATITEDGILTPTKLGTICLIATSKVNPEVTDSLKIRIAEDIFDVKVADTVGKAYDFYGNPCALSNEDYTATFKSTKYKSHLGLELPTHKQIKEENLEVLVKTNGEFKQITNFTIENDVLTIPHDEIVGDIEIHILGGEISDFITWQDLRDISDNDIKSKTQKAMELFQVGDYKDYYDAKKESVKGKALLIDMFFNKYIEMEEGEEVEHTCPFTFQLGRIEKKIESTTHLEGHIPREWYHEDNILCPYLEMMFANPEIAPLGELGNIARVAERPEYNEGQYTGHNNLPAFLFTTRELNAVNDHHDDCDIDGNVPTSGHICAYYDDEQYISTVPHYKRRVKFLDTSTIKHDYVWTITRISVDHNVGHAKMNIKTGKITLEYVDAYDNPETQHFLFGVSF